MRLLCIDHLKWGMYGIIYMTLIEAHKNLFLEECARLTRLVYDCLQKLEKDPSDLDTLERMVNAADVIRGGAKFLHDADLEMTSKLLIELFKGAQDLHDREKEIEMMQNRFGLLVKRSLHNFCPS